MQNIVKFLKDSIIFYLATVEDDQPRVRPMGFVMEYNGKIAFCTSNTKEMYKQMKKNPKIELVACVDTKTLRITGEAEFITSNDSQTKALDEMPMLKSVYAAGDGKFEIFAIKNPVASYISMSGKRENIKL